MFIVLPTPVTATPDPCHWVYERVRRSEQRQIPNTVVTNPTDISVHRLTEEASGDNLGTVGIGLGMARTGPGVKPTAPGMARHGQQKQPRRDHHNYNSRNGASRRHCTTPYLAPYSGMRSERYSTNTCKSSLPLRL